MMASATLSQKQLNFARCSILCVDIIKLPLIDILRIFIDPCELRKNIKECRSLQYGEHKLNQDQETKCCCDPSICITPNYNMFDVTLLYKLIRHLCPSLEPTNKWGNKPTTKDLSVGDDIERIRELRNSYFAHTESAEISNDDFEELWKAAKSMLYRLQHFTTSKGSKKNYIQKIVDLERKALTFNEYITYRELPGGKQSNLLYCCHIRFYLKPYRNLFKRFTYNNSCCKIIMLQQFTFMGRNSYLVGKQLILKLKLH